MQQQNIQSTISLITRENLNLTEARLQAERNAVGPGRAVEQLDFEKQQAQGRIRVAYSEIAAGQTPTYDIGQQISVLANQALNPETYKKQLANLEAQHGVAQTGFDQTLDQLNKGIAAIPFKQIGQDLESIIIPAQVIARNIDETMAAMNRALEAANLAMGPQRIAAETALSQALEKEAAAAERIAAAQAATGGLPPVQVTINVGSNTGLTSGQQGDISALVQQIQDATSTAVMDGIIRAQSQNTPRINSNIAAAR